jgi:hypothetical protein
VFFHLDGQLIESPTLKIFLFISVMCDLVARTGRLQQRYEDGSRLVAGCIPFRYVNSDKDGNSESGKVIQVLMISSSSGPGLLFPKVQSKRCFFLLLPLFGNKVTYPMIHIGRMGE